VTGRWLGIDFSGNHLMWRNGCTRSNVWIAELHAVGRGLELVDLRPVQQLAGDGEPFARLVALLRAGDHEAAAVDAPFSVPAGLVAYLRLAGRGNKTWRACERGAGEALAYSAHWA